MNKHKCLYCYRELAEPEKDFHPACSRKIFLKSEPPELPYSEKDMEQLAKQVIRSQKVVTGAQAKLSLSIEEGERSKDPLRFTIVGLWGEYILKPPTSHYKNLPEIEDVTMHLAELCKIQTVPHSLIRLASGSLAYITKRIDRDRGQKIHIEDMCQITEHLTEDKYRGSYEQIAKAIFNYSVNPHLDVVNFYEQVVFSFLTGNADMHLKNFSLVKQPGTGYVLAPAYDMVATALVIKNDKEELALTLDGKKNNITRTNFVNAFHRAGMDEKVILSLFKKFEKAIPVWMEFIEKSFLPVEMKEEYKELVGLKAGRLWLG